MDAVNSQPAILIVDDELSILKALNRLLRNKGCPIRTASSGAEGLKQIRESDVPIALIISDQRMPEMNGAQFLEQAKALMPDAMRFLLTGYSDLGAVIDAVNKGEIHRYLTKPWNDEELALSVSQALEHYRVVGENRRLLDVTRRQNQELGDLNRHLEDKVRERTLEIQAKNEALSALNTKLEQSFMDTIRLMSSLIETLNPKLGKYMRHVAHLSILVAGDLGLSADDVHQIEMAALIHEVGLLGLPDRFWEKDEKELSESESRQFNNHPVIASVCLEPIEKLSAVSQIVRCHHECVDGSGFPDGIRDEAIPIGARIIAAAGDYCRVLDIWKPEKTHIYDRAKAHLGVAAGRLSATTPEAMRIEVAQKLLVLHSRKKYDFRIVTAILKHGEDVPADTAHPGVETSGISEVDVDRLAEGMVLASDLRLKDGRLLLARDSRLKATSIDSIRRLYAHGLVGKRILTCK